MSKGVETLDPEHWERLVASGVAAAALAGKRIREGVIAVEPEDPGFCERLCAFSSVCRVES